MMFEQETKNYQEEMISHLQQLIQIPSVNGTASLGKPFGDGPDHALNYLLALGNELGFKTKNIDGYCGYIEFGDGPEMVGIIGHLDVVPEGENWTYPPFSATLADGKIYGRGAIDDKGPVIASLYAMKAVKDYCERENITLSKRVRLIVGLNEEKDWKCIEYYQSHEEMPTIGFSPDADFPCIYAEKGILTEFFSMDYSSFMRESKSPMAITLSHLEDNGNAINVVPRLASAVIYVNRDYISQEKVLSMISSLLEKEPCAPISWEEDVTLGTFEVVPLNENEIKITSYGVQAHAAHPDLGVNAISPLVVLLTDLFREVNGQDQEIPIFSFFTEKIGIDFSGLRCGIDSEDESGKLTLNVGKLSFDGNTISIGCNLRIPVSVELMTIHQKFLEMIKPYSFVEIGKTETNDPLYVSPDSPLVQTLCDIYQETTGVKEKPIAIGGATYARAFPNCVSFGANLPGQKDMCHQSDEYVSIDNLNLANLIYARAVFALGK